MATQQTSANFEKERIKSLEKIYSDPTSARANYNKSSSSGGVSYADAISVRNAIKQGLTDKTTLVQASINYYNTNPIYSTIINYLANIFLWRYTVIPHRLYNAKSRKVAAKLEKVYPEMMELVEGLNLENKIPAALLQLLIEGGVYFTTYYDSESSTINTLLLPSKYCKKVAETQFGTSVIKFDYSYFNSLGLSKDEVEDYLLSFPDEMQQGYRLYQEDSAHNRWQDLDPHFSSCVLLNEKGIPNYVYAVGSIINYETYGDNELARNKNLLKYIVVHKMPLYQDQLIFTTDEVAAIHKSLAKVVNKGDEAKLITTYGDVKIEKIAESDKTANEVLAKSYGAVFDNVGLNNVLFTGQSVEALKYSLRRDKAIIWQYVEQLMNFYNLAINNYVDFQGFQAEIQMLQISQYSYEDDIQSYRENATLGVNKLDYLVASGIKQKNIADRLELEDFLHLENLKPLQTSYTQTADDRESGTEQKEEKKTSQPVEEVKDTNQNNEEDGDEQKD